MTPRPPDRCPHDIRPGTTVCLHCRHEAKLVADARTRTAMMRGGAVLAVVAVVVAGGVAGATALRSSRSSRATPTLDPAAMAPIAQASLTASVPAERAKMAAPAPVAATTVADTTRAAAPAPAAVAPPAVAPAAVMSPSVGEGRTELGAGVFAERSGDTVSVHFDTPLTRTRRPDKFERVVRETLPRVFGGGTDAMLAALPAGALSRPVEEMTRADRPMRLGAGAAALSMWAETRDGRDGPLIVTYRVVAAR